MKKRIVTVTAENKEILEDLYCMNLPIGWGVDFTGISDEIVEYATHPHQTRYSTPAILMTSVLKATP